MDNHALRVIFAPKSNKDAKDISEMLGDTTVKGQTKSRNIAGRESKSISTSDQRRALLLPQELRSLGANNQIIMVEDCPPILCRKIRYYKERVFKARLEKAPAMELLHITERENPSFTFSTSGLSPSMVERAITPADIANIDQLEIEDFSCDFSSVEIPTGEISDQQMNQIVDQFFDGLEAAAL